MGDEMAGMARGGAPVEKILYGIYCIELTWFQPLIVSMCCLGTRRGGGRLSISLRALVIFVIAVQDSASHNGAHKNT
jgi:hypothetical protein